MVEYDNLVIAPNKKVTGEKKEYEAIPINVKLAKYITNIKNCIVIASFPTMINHIEIRNYCSIEFIEDSTQFEKFLKKLKIEDKDLFFINSTKEMSAAIISDIKEKHFKYLS